MEIDRLYGRKILIVEDEYFSAYDISDFLEQAGADIIGPVSTVEAALDLLDQQKQLDLVILDVKLRDEESFPIADILQSQGKPFLFLTGYDHVNWKARYPGAAVLGKPVQYEALLAAALTAL